MIEAKDLIEIIKNSDVTTSDVLELIFEKNLVDKEKYPNAFDKDGNVLLKFESKKTYNTFCPYHDGQENGDSFAIFNEDKSAFCFNGSCPAGEKPMDLIDIVMSLVLNLDHSIINDFELKKTHFWSAARVIVTHFRERLGVSLNDITSNKKTTKNKTESILNDTASYYHFLGTVTFFAEGLNKFLTEERFLNYGEVPIDKLVEKYKIGVTRTGWDSLYKYLIKRKYTKEEILESKVCYLDKDGQIKDFFYDRAIIPYLNNGKVIGLYGRSMKSNGNKRWRHLRLEGEVRIPNGLNDILNEEEFFLVEGEFSKIAVAALGYDNVMESRGVNGFKREHAEMIGRVREGNSNKCKRCYLLFDPDESGADSIRKIGKRLINEGVEVLVIRLPIIEMNDTKKYIDPNDLLSVYKNKAKEKFEELKSSALSYDAFVLLHEIEKESPKTFSEARMTFKRLRPYIQNIELVERIFILEEFLDALQTAMDKNVLREYLKVTWLKEEAVKQIEGLEDIDKTSSPFLLATKDEEFYQSVKDEFDFILMIRDFELFKDKKIDKRLLLDESFTKEEEGTLKDLSFNVIRGKVLFDQIDKSKFTYDIISDVSHG